MNIEVELTEEAIEVPERPSQSGPGAVVEFRGIVRANEDGAPISALIYEAYPPMAARQIREILGELSVTMPCLSALVIHRFGIVPSGETAVYVRIEATHRGEALAMVAEFMNRLKRDVPIWKTGVVPC